MATFVLAIRHAFAPAAAAVIFAAALTFGSAGTAHAKGTFSPPEPHAQVHTQGPFSVLHQGPAPVRRQGPFSVLHQGR